MPGVKVRVMKEDDYTLARVLHVSHGRGSFKTPTVTGSIYDVDGKILEPGEFEGIIEVFASFRAEHLKTLSSDKRSQRRFEHRISSRLSKLPSDKLVVATPSFERAEIVIGEPQEYGSYLAELLSHPRVDVLATPVFHRVGEEYALSFLDSFLEAATTLRSNVAISIPHFSRRYIREIVRIYQKWAGINNRLMQNFVLADFEGSNPVSRHVFYNIVLGYARSLEEELGEPVVVHGVNIKYSKVASKYAELPARDIASYFARLDILGFNHRRLPLPGEVVERYASREAGERVKILSRKLYAYMDLSRALTEGALPKPDEGAVRKLLSEYPRSRSLEVGARRLNIKFAAKEASAIQQLLFKGDWAGFRNSLDYLKSKKSISNDKAIEIIQKFRSRFRPKAESLDKFL